MTNAVFPLWIFAVVAAAIAAFAFAMGQVWPGSGVLFTAAASTAWVAFVVRRGARR